MRIVLEIQNTENIDNWDTSHAEEIINALIVSGGLTGVKGGQTIIHFDGDGIFQKIELKYFPWMRRNLTRRR